MKLSIPYMNQQNNAIRNDCGPACAAMLVNAYTDDVVSIEDYYSDLGIEPGGYQAVKDLQRFMGDFSVKSSWVINSDFRDIQAWMDARLASIALISYKPLVDAGLTHYAGDFTHFVVIAGATDTSVLIHDPYYPDNSGAYVEIPRDVFQAAWDSVPPAYGPKGGAILCTDRLGADMPYTTGQYKVTANYLNVRSGPGVNYPTVMPGLKKDNVVTVLEVLGNWGQIGEQRYASLNYMVLISAPPEPGAPLVVAVKRTGQHIDIDLPVGVELKIIE